MRSGGPPTAGRARPESVKRGRTNAEGHDRRGPEAWRASTEGEYPRRTFMAGSPGVGWLAPPHKRLNEESKPFGRTACGRGRGMGPKTMPGAPTPPPPQSGVLWAARYDGQARALSKIKSSSVVPDAPFGLDKEPRPPYRHMPSAGVPKTEGNPRWLHDPWTSSNGGCLGQTEGCIRRGPWSPLPSNASLPAPSLATVPYRRFIEGNPDFKCDVVFIDGEKFEKPRYDDIMNFRKISTLDTVLYMDEVNTLECVNGTVDRGHDKCKEKQAWWGASLAYNSLVKEGKMVMDKCSFEIPGDGMCSARFLV